MSGNGAAISASNLKTYRAKREKLAEAAPLHPKEEAELARRAVRNVKEDLLLLRDIAERRVSLTHKRLKYLGQCELSIVNALLKTLETL